MNNTIYPIGIPGKKWGESEKQIWREQQSIKRSYKEQVVSKLQKLSQELRVHQYGELPYSQEQYPLYLILPTELDPNKPSILVTGGVHGYETSGVHGALEFAISHAAKYLSSYNIYIAPCISPWGYETINRWNPNAVDPNRSFYQDSPAPESALLLKAIEELDINPIAHIDLHETTDTDNSEFRPALGARDGVEHKEWEIPDGFYLVGDTIKPQFDFQKAIIEKVEKVTHIAPPDPEKRIIGEKITQHGVINYATKELGLCAGMTDAEFVTTTEVYPDSPLVDDQNCIDAQVAAVVAVIEYLQGSE